MGLEIDRLHKNKAWVLYDTTSGDIEKFHDVDTLKSACTILGRDIKTFGEEYLLEKFENEIIFDWTDMTYLNYQLDKIRELFK